MENGSPALPNSTSHRSSCSNKYEKVRDASPEPNWGMAHHHHPEMDPRDPRREAAIAARREEHSDRMAGNLKASRQCSRPSPAQRRLTNANEPNRAIHLSALAIIL